MEQQVKPGTLLRLKEEWNNPHHGMALRPGDVIMIIVMREGDFLFSFDAITPDGDLKPFAVIAETLDHWFDMATKKKEGDAV